MGNVEALAADAARDAPGRDPLALLNSWYDEAVHSGAPLPDAMTLATATLEGRPAARIVLFKGILRGGVFFVTNYQSRKARELEANPRAALVMHFMASERQVRVEGRVERCSDAESDAYFASRPRGSQLGAWASPQSSPIASRDELERRLAEVEARYRDQAVPRPESWGGYLVFPERVELWLGRPDRLHDRFEYRPGADASGWQISRLAP
jgi:pyridoxamine 5'-phosphate oxidase